MMTNAHEWFTLGEDYYSKKPPKYFEAYSCYQNAIDLNPKLAIAHVALGWLYEYGQGVDQNLEKAKNHYKKAAAEGHEGAIKQLLILSNPVKTTEEWDALGERYYHSGKKNDEVKSEEKGNKKNIDYINARFCYEQAIKLNSRNINSLCSLGFLYHHGKGVTKDLKKAMSYYNKASALGHEGATRQFIFLAYPRLKTAEEWHTLGCNYYFGDKKPKDWVKARLCYEKALEFNPRYSPAHSVLGWIYEHGRGVNQNLEKAIFHYKKAVAEGHEKSIKQLLILNNPDKTAEEWNALGESYYDSGKKNDEEKSEEKGDKKNTDYISARFCYEKAIELNSRNVNSLYSLGFLYHFGIGVTKNLKKAKSYYDKASALGHEDATRQFIFLEYSKLKTPQEWCALGCSYYLGNNKPKNQLKARICFEKAYELNPRYPSAYFYLGWLYEHGEEIEKDLDKAKVFYDKASKLGDVDATERFLLLTTDPGMTSEGWKNLGEQYFLDDVESKKHPDYDKARWCYEKAIELNPDDFYSHDRLGELYEQGKGGFEKNLEKAVEHYFILAKRGDIASRNKLSQLAETDNDPDAQYALGQLPKEENESKEEKHDEIDWSQKAIDTWNKLTTESLGSISPHQHITEKIEIYNKVISYLTKSKNAGSEWAEEQLNLLKNQFITSLLYQALRHHKESIWNLEAKECNPYSNLLNRIDKKYEDYSHKKFIKEIEDEEKAKHTYFGEDLSDDSDSEEEKSFQKCSYIIRQSALMHSHSFFHKAHLPKTKKLIKRIIDNKKAYNAAKPILDLSDSIAKTSTAPDVLKDLREINYWRDQGNIKEGLRRIKTRFVIAQYRGITYKVTDWSQSARRTHRKMDEIKAPLFSASAYKEAKLPYTTDCLHDQKAGTILLNYAKEIKKRLLRLREPKEYIAKYKVDKVSRDYRFDNIAEYLQHEYTKNYDNFGKILKDGEVTSEKQGSVPEKLNLLNAGNPFISTGDIPLHALKYAYGIKPYKGHRHERLRPRWRKDETGVVGRAERPYSGKAYVSLHKIEDYDDENPLHVISLNHLGKVRINDNPKGFQIINERETTFPGFIPQGRIVHTHVAKYPSFNKAYKEIYATKYGMDEEVYNLFQAALAEFPPHSKQLESTKVLLGEYLCSYHQFRLLEQASIEATKLGAVLVYVDEFGKLGLNLPPLPAAAKKDKKDLHNLKSMRKKRHASEFFPSDNKEIKESKEEKREGRVKERDDVESYVAQEASELQPSGRMRKKIRLTIPVQGR